jgi:peptidoglycan/LPS O-acetylase OafA/YrhL
MGLIRLFLACVVAADHWRKAALEPHSLYLTDYFKLGFNSGYAVMFFYVISGFLITYALSHKYGRDTGTFYKNRFIRIFALYWAVLILVLFLIPHERAAFLQADAWDRITAITLVGLDWNYFFGGEPAIDALGQAWTLSAELVFYAVAPWLMRSWKIGAALLAMSFVLRVGFTDAGLGIAWVYYFAPSTFGFFMLGHLACLASQRWPGLAAAPLGLVLLACSLLAMLLWPHGSFDSWRFWISVLFFAACLPGLFDATRNVRWMNFAGDLSYPVYLVHIVTMLCFSQATVRVLLSWSPYLSTVTVLAIVILAAIVVHLLLELPLGRLMHRIRISKSRTAVQRRSA